MLDKEGGFPELISGEENPKEYISTLIDNIISQDIKKREIKGCIAGAKATKCDNLFLITDHDSGIRRLSFCICSASLVNAGKKLSLLTS